MFKTFYSTRKWLNREESPSTGSIVCYDGEEDIHDKIYRNLFIEVKDCINVNLMKFQISLIN